MNKPIINVTPLIDVLLVLLIIFMVVAPLKPTSFKMRVPSEPNHYENIRTNIDTLVAAVEKDGKLRLNTETDMGTTDDPAKLITRLKDVFAVRIASGDVSGSFADDPNRPTQDRVERTVFIKAPRSLDYGSAAHVVDAVKLAGAYPICLQIDDLD